jgi:hypothetical protein
VVALAAPLRQSKCSGSSRGGGATRASAALDEPRSLVWGPTTVLCCSHALVLTHPRRVHRSNRGRGKADQHAAGWTAGGRHGRATRLPLLDAALARAWLFRLRRPPARERQSPAHKVKSRREDSSSPTRSAGMMKRSVMTQCVGSIGTAMRRHSPTTVVPACSRALNGLGKRGWHSVLSVHTRSSCVRSSGRGFEQCEALCVLGEQVSIALRQLKRGSLGRRALLQGG